MLTEWPFVTTRIIKLQAAVENKQPVLNEVNTNKWKSPDWIYLAIWKPSPLTMSVPVIGIYQVSMNQGRILVKWKAEDAVVPQRQVETIGR